MSKHLTGPMEKFIEQYGPALEEFDRQSAKTTPFDTGTAEGSLKMIARSQALQMHNWAAGIAVTRRHGFLKKVIEEIR